MSKKGLIFIKLLKLPRPRLPRRLANIGDIATVENISKFSLFSLVVSNLFAIPSLTIGVVFRSQCPVQIWIPRFLIGLGVANAVQCICSVVQVLVSIFCYFKKSDLFTLIITILSIVLLFSEAVWMIFGSVWTYGVKSHVQFNNVTDENYCHRAPYYTASVFLIIFYSGMGTILCSTFTVPIYC